MFVSMEQVKLTRRLMKRGRCEFPDIYDRQKILGFKKRSSNAREHLQ